MTKQHKATPDDWAQQEGWAKRLAFSNSSCILELRDRIEALESAQQPLAFTGQVVAPITNQAGPGVALYLDPSERQHVVTSDRLIARDTPAPGNVPFPVAPPNCRQRLLRDGKPYPKSSCEACGSLSPMWRQCNAALMALEPTTQPPAGSLVATDADLCKVYNEKTTLRAVYDLGRQHGAAPVQPAPESSPAGSLVDRVGAAIGSAPTMELEDEARAAILEVAAWLKEEGYSTLQAEALAQEANR
jgi:hypothetical protein